MLQRLDVLLLLSQGSCTSDAAYLVPSCCHMSWLGGDPNTATRCSSVVGRHISHTRWPYTHGFRISSLLVRAAIISEKTSRNAVGDGGLLVRAVAIQAVWREEE